MRLASTPARLPRESDVTQHLDAWLLSVFDPKNLDAAVAALSAAQAPDDGAVARAEAARRAVKDCDARLAKYRGALEAGADPAVVAGWIKEVEGDRLHAERELASTAGSVQPLRRPRFGPWWPRNARCCARSPRRHQSSGRRSTARRWAYGSRTTRAALRSKSKRDPRVLRCVSEGLVEQKPIGGSNPGTWESRRPEAARVRFL